MKKYTATVTENDIRFEIETAVSELEQDGQIAFPDRDTRAEFIEDCVRSQIDRVEMYGSNPFRSGKEYSVDVLDMAALYGYTL